MCAVAFNPQQLAVANRALRRARRFGASPRETLALAEAGLVESNLTHLTGGDRDSTGFLQQRPSQGWGPVGESVGRDTAQFLRAARRLTRSGFQGSAGALAQAVQRSAFPERYDQRRADAVALLRATGSVGGVRGVSGPAGGAGGGTVVPGVQGAQGLPQGSEGITALLEALRAPPQPRASAGLQAPAFSARAVMPAGAQVPSGGGGPAPPSKVDELLAQIQTVGGDVQMAPGNAGGVAGGRFGGVPAQGQVSVSSRGGRVVLDPNADRPGVRTSQGVIAFAKQVSAIAGSPVRIGTGTRHSRLTVNGNVSDHWGGNAGDIPASGRRLVRLGQAALIAAGMPEAQARKQTGGLYNVGGAQIIFATNEGGNHYDHLHVRPPRRRRG